MDMVRLIAGRLFRRGGGAAAGALVIACAGVLACIGGPAEAQAGLTIPLPGRSAAEFALRGSHGYKIEVRAESEGEISLLASRRTASVSYRVAGGKSPGLIRASFGRLGKLDLKFVPNGRVKHERPRRGCRGKAATLRLGRFTGTIRFTGERRYTVVRAASAPATITHTPPRECSIGALTEAHRSNAAREVELTAADPRHGRLLLARRPSADTSREPALFIAEKQERREGVEISRVVFASAGHGSFQIDSDLTTAELSPPAPFEGTGRFRTRADGTTSWTGDLRASFPGAPGVPFTGPSLKTRLGTSEGF